MEDQLRLGRELKGRHGVEGLEEEEKEEDEGEEEEEEKPLGIDGMSNNKVD